MNKALLAAALNGHAETEQALVKAMAELGHNGP